MATSRTLPRVRVDGEQLERLRLERFMSRAELGKRAGMHPDSIGRLERGTWPGGSRVDNIRKLAEALGVDPHELLKED